MNRYLKKIKLETWEGHFEHRICEVEEYLDRTLDLVQIFNLNIKTLQRH